MVVEMNPPFRVDVECFSTVLPNRKVTVEEREPETGRACKTTVERLNDSALILSHTDWHGSQFAMWIDLRAGTAQLHEAYVGDLRYAEISTQLLVDTCRKHFCHQGAV
ncbi:hypothetical protein [Roseateles puraquae]|uniref:hypothetical protein n=1 Tax=Roseateles puraquae TaxID=431059 RepID=UPI0013030154|nr:hypothetical protein [Roseateles puraquae]MDG0857458.1 hypothetical protein [Roseateles puraquae]